MTRAQFGEVSSAVPSRFLEEIPAELVEWRTPPSTIRPCLVTLKLTRTVGFQQDIYDLPSEGLRRRAIEILAHVAKGEVHGVRLDARVATGDLSDCRKLYFDEDPTNPKPNYLLVHRLTPSEAHAGAVEAVSVGERFELDAYLRAQRNLGRP